MFFLGDIAIHHWFAWEPEHISHCISKGFLLLAFRWWPKHWKSRWRIVTIVGPTVDSSSPQSSLRHTVIIVMLISKSFEVLIVFFLQFDDVLPLLFLPFPSNFLSSWGSASHHSDTSFDFRDAYTYIHASSRSSDATNQLLMEHFS